MDPIFHHGGVCRELPIPHQLALTLERLGSKKACFFFFLSWGNNLITLIEYRIYNICGFFLAWLFAYCYVYEGEVEGYYL